MKLPNFVCGQWQEGTGAGEPIVDPVTGDELARISSEGLVGVKNLTACGRCSSIIAAS
jgi:hypothetical protein